jgi:hypothetical protein
MQPHSKHLAQGRPHHTVFEGLFRLDDGVNPDWAATVSLRDEIPSTRQWGQSGYCGGPHRSSSLSGNRRLQINVELELLRASRKLKSLAPQIRTAQAPSLIREHGEESHANPPLWIEHCLGR